MKIKSLLLPAVLLALNTSVSAQEQETNYLFDFGERATFNACTQVSLRYDHDGMDVWKYDNYGNFPYMYNYDITEPYYDDYLVTAGIELQAGHMYRLQTAPAAYRSGKTGNLEISIGQDEDYEAYTLLQSFTDLPYAADATTAELRTVDFTVPADGTYKLAFRGIGNALYMFSTAIIDSGVSGVPAAVSDLTLLPAPDGSQSVTVTFTMPSQTKSGAPLDGNLTYRIYRDNSTEPLKGGRGVPGEFIQWTDTAAPLGNVTYSVAVIQGENVSDLATATTYVGSEIPLPVTNLAVSQSVGAFTISWTAPETGVNGAVLNPSLLTYRVERYVDGNLDATFNDIAVNSYVDNYTADGLRTLQYKVYALMGENVSEGAASDEFTVGNMSLPFADSFAGATFGDKWTTEVVNGTANWQAVAEATNQQPLPTPQDGDGGMAKYNSWTASSGHSARLITVPISKASSTNPLIEFYVCRSSSPADDKLKIEVSCDNGNWTDVPESEVTVSKGTAGLWEKYSFSLAAATAAAVDSYRVSITAISGYGHNTYIDNVRIFNVTEYDLAAQLLAPESVISGNNIEATIILSNNGTHAAAAADYTVELISDYPGELPAIQSIDIPALERREIVLSIPVNAPIVKELSQYSFQAKVNYSSDLVTGNNISDAVITNAAFVEHPGVEAIESTVNADGNIVLSWSSVGDGHVPLSISESFESFDDGATGPYNGFTVIDKDEMAGNNYYNTSGSALHVINKGAVPTKVDGSKLLGCTTQANKQQDDWLISPELSCAPGAVMKLQFAIAAKKFSSSYDYKYEVLYSTTEYDPANPSEAFTNLLKTVTASNYSSVFHADETMWEQTIENIPAEAKYVAIHLITKISYDAALWLDNIRIVEDIPFWLTGYNVYDTDGRKYNDALLPAETTSYTIETEAQRESTQYYVVAVYNDGEATPSPEKGVDTGIESVSGTSVKIAAVGNTVVVMNSDSAVAVYDTAGRKIAAAPAADRVEISLAPGLYIVKTGQTVRKVIVR